LSVLQNVKKLSEIAFDMENGDYIVDFFLYKNNLIVQSNLINAANLNVGFTA